MTQIHGSRTDVVGNGYVLTPFFNNATFGGSRDSAENTTFKMTSKSHVPGVGDSSMSFGGFWAGDIDEADQILQAALGSGDGIFSYFPATQDVVGNFAYSLQAFETAYDITTPVGGMAGVSAAIAAGSGAGIERGRVNHPLAQENAAGNGVVVDSGIAAGSPNGGSLVLHVVNAVNLVAFLQDSADGVTFADLPGSLAVAAGRSSLRLGIAGTIRRYTRVRWTGTGQFLSITNRK
jgi:hypothetical protein